MSFSDGMKLSQLFLFLSAAGVVEAFIHAWNENAFTTNWMAVPFGPYASVGGIPYWAFGVVWFPLVLVTAAWATKLGRESLGRRMLILLTIGNVFTGYLWFVDLVITGSFTAAYVGLYMTNYALTTLVVLQNWAQSGMREFATGTALGMVVGVFFGAFGVAFLGILGGILGAVGGYTSTK